MVGGIEGREEAFYRLYTPILFYLFSIYNIILGENA